MRSRRSATSADTALNEAKSVELVGFACSWEEIQHGRDLGVLRGPPDLVGHKVSKVLDGAPTLMPAPSQAPAPRDALRPGTGVQAAIPLGAHRAILLLACLGLFWPTLSAWGEIVAAPSLGVAVVALIGGALGLACAVAMAKTEAALARLDVWLLVLGLLVLGAWAASTLYGQSGYGTDEAAFEQGAANLLLHGHDPYGANLLGALSEYAVPGKYATYTMSGGLVSTLGYPALPLLIVAFFVKLTGGGQAVPIADVVVLMIAAVVMFKALPSGWRALAVVVCVGFPIFAGFAVSGLNMVIMMAALIAVAHRWMSTGESGALTRGDQLRACAFGLALATNQLAWFVAPFLLSGIFLARRSHLGRRGALRVSAAYVGLATVTFAAINAPFFLWEPGAWLGGVTAPLTQHAIPYGQGVVGLTLFLRIGGGAIDAYAYAAGCLYVALLIAYAMRFRDLGRCCFVFPAVALFMSGRSLSGYWTILVAVMLVSVFAADEHTVARAAQVVLPRLRKRSRPASRRRDKVPRRLATVALLLPPAIFLAIALGTPQPLTMRIASARSDSSLRSVWQLRVAVLNRSDEVLRPHFATNTKGQATGFWTRTDGPSFLAAHASATYVLSAPDVGSMPPNGTPFVLQAVTGSPRTISSTAPFSQPGPAPGNW